MLDISRRTRKS